MSRMGSWELPKKTVRRIYILGNLGRELDMAGSEGERVTLAAKYAAYGMRYMAKRLRGEASRLELANKQREQARLDRIDYEGKILAKLGEIGTVQPRALALALGMSMNEFYNKSRGLRKNGKIERISVERVVFYRRSEHEQQSQEESQDNP